VLRIRLSAALGAPAVLALPVVSTAPVGADEAVLLDSAVALPDRLTLAARAFLADTDHSGVAGTVQALPRPGGTPRRLLLVGLGTGDEAGWRAAGAGLARAAQKDDRLTVALAAAGAPGERPEPDPAALRGLVEGLLLAAYRFRLGSEDEASTPKLRQVTVLVPAPDRYADELAAAQATAELTCLARDLTNWPSMEKSPGWFANRISREAGRRPGLTVTVREPAQLAVEGFNGILAVGGGSARGPRLVELSYRPRGAKRHVVLIGKGITFDTGGISIKHRDAMKLMRKDMAGAAAVMAATLGAATLRLPVRITTLAPLAENMISGDSFRPGDVVRHYGGRTSEITNTDAEGRIVLADALAYAVRRLRPDVIVDLATLTGANSVALGKRTAALYAENDELAGQLEQAAAAAGERVWRMPLTEDYLELLRSDVADLSNAADGGAGSITAALFLREFVGAASDRWVHLDMSAPSWAEGADGELVKGATGWGVRTLLRWLTDQSGVEAGKAGPTRPSSDHLMPPVPAGP
jgi:leucyl aminopeptidase